MTPSQMYAVIALTLSVSLVAVYGSLAWGYARWWRRWRGDTRSSLAMLSTFALVLFALSGLVGALSSPLIWGPSVEARFVNSLLRGALLTIGVALLLTRRDRK